MITFSFIVPVYNVEDYLAECLDSLRAQTYPHWEAILVDDCSKDATRSIAERYAAEDPRFTLIVNAENQGPSKTRNTALRRAGGDYICFVDSDDWIDADTLQRMVGLIAEYPGIDVVAGDYISFEHDTRAEIDTTPSFPPDMFLTPVDGKAYYRQLLDRRIIFFSIWANAFHRDLILTRPTLFDEAVSIAEDLEWKTRILMDARNVIQLHYKYYHHRLRTDSLIGSRCSYRFVHSYKQVMGALRKTTESVTDPEVIYIHTHLLRSMIVNLMKSKEATGLFKNGDRAFFTESARWLSRYPLPRGTAFGLFLIAHFPPIVFQTFYRLFKMFGGRR